MEAFLVMFASDLFDLSGRVALVTGGSRGLGAEVVRVFAEAGADVVIVSRNGTACEEYAAQISASTGVRAIGLPAHLGRWDTLDSLVDRAYSEMGHVDILVNNAGMAPLYDSLESVTEVMFDKVVGVNLKGPFRLSTLVGRRMATSTGGSIINISSTGALRPTGDALPYTVAKAGLNALTVGLAHALAPTVRVNAIVAGWFMTEMSKSWSDDVITRHARSLALQRLGNPSEIAGTALYLASAASSFTTGTLLTVDGGEP
jgi:NAD(P)-dependent dehydrogenase (short-subunit alcohol dehydrogenase family)